eukprot:412992_1
MNLQVKYNIDAAEEENITDTIPQHKEITPHPADDFTMTNGTPPNWVNGFVDFEEYNELKSHKESLPLTIQRIIEYAQQQIGHNKLIKLNYDEIENDLKYQYNKYNGNATKLKEIYFDKNPFNLMYFERECDGKQKLDWK